jgi:hypothetical protein
LYAAASYWTLHGLTRRVLQYYVPIRHTVIVKKNDRCRVYHRNA